MADEKLYTLEEALRTLKKQECKNRGHEFHIWLTGMLGGAPASIECQRCGKKWSVVEQKP